MTGHNHSHFHGKVPLDHVTEARRKGKVAGSEIHGEELSGHYSSLGSCAKETAILIVLIISIQPTIDPKLLGSLLFGWLVWKTGCSALLGWRRLERLHRLIEEERWEIEHHRPQEKEELTALYTAKGFSEKQLAEVVEVLMADDNRLLQIMLEEELGLNLEAYEHPLKQAAGAAIGALTSSLILLAGFILLPLWVTFLFAATIIAAASGFTAHAEKNLPLQAIIWNLATAFLAYGCTHFISQLFHVV